MGTAIIFGLVAILAIFAFIGALKNRNVLALVFTFGTVAVFGFFSIMTIIKSGFPQ
ncbi:cysteine desulfhydrase [Bacillus freudenreichii]|nr:cysteine desulfhydrase [Bacillus freudenreichii]